MLKRVLCLAVTAVLYCPDTGNTKHRTLIPCRPFIRSLLPNIVIDKSLDTSMMWRILCELLILSKFVSLSVIHDNRKLVVRAPRVTQEPKTQKLARKRRDLFSSDDYEEDEYGRWEAICPLIDEFEPIAPLLDSQGERIFRLGSQFPDFADFNPMVNTQRCRRTFTMVGGARVQCQQQFLEQTVFITDKRTQQEIFSRKIFIPSGCEAQTLSPR